MKILIFGKTGQVGQELSRILPSLGEVQSIGREDLDLKNLSHLQDLMTDYDPNIIVNAAAYTAVDKAEMEKDSAFAINADAVRVMANYAKEQKILFIHYSTDYVFDGQKLDAYVESDKPNPLNIYGKSKRAGEEFIFESGCCAIIFRTSWVYSVHGQNFLKKIIALAKERDCLNVVNDQFGVPTSAQFIAHITEKAIQKYQHHTFPCGLYHLTPSGQTTWYDFACFIVQQALENGVELRLNQQNISAVSSEFYPLPAKRPLNSRLNSRLLQQSLGSEFPDWKIDVVDVIKQLQN